MKALSEMTIEDAKELRARAHAARAKGTSIVTFCEALGFKVNRYYWVLKKFKLSPDGDGDSATPNKFTEFTRVESDTINLEINGQKISAAVMDLPKIFNALEMRKA